MNLLRGHSWPLGIAMASVLSLSLSAFAATPASDRPDLRQGQVTDCLSPEEFLRRSLARHLGALSMNNQTVKSVVARLETDYSVPVSFIDSDDSANITLAMSRPAVQEVLANVARASGPAIGLLDPKPGPAPDRSCMSTDEFARRSLARRLRFLTVSNESVHAVVDRLVVDEDVPLSFIQSDDEAKNGTEISFDLAHPTVQEALEELVHLVPGYRYATIEGHILLFPSNSRWETQVDNVHIGPETRRQAASELASELRRRLPTFSDFGTFFIQTSQFVYEDQVSVVRGGSVAELLARLLGNRPAAIFSVSRSSPTLSSMFLSLGCVTYWNALLIAPSESVMHMGESIQLKVAGSPHDGTTHQSITAGACGTDYWISDTNIANLAR